MTSFNVLRMGLNGLRRSVLRSALTSLGIIIGVASVVALVSIGNGVKAEMDAVLAGVEANQVSISARMPDRPGRTPLPVPVGEGLTMEDYEAIRRLVGSFALSSPYSPVVAADIRANGRSGKANVIGLDGDGRRILSRRLIDGVDFGASDISRRGPVCLITETVARRLFGVTQPAEAVGRLLKIQTMTFSVIGVMADVSAAGANRSEIDDMTVFIPYTSLIYRLDRRAPLSLVLKAHNPADLGTLQRLASDLLEERRGARRAEFVVADINATLDTYRRGNDAMTLFLASTASIALVVGGIGIMNIMLVSVTERTREIGIRLAIGTRAGDVMRQFLIEAVILSVLGGLAGIGCGIGAAQMITALNGWPTHVSVGSVFFAFLCSAAIGIFFGFYPASRASRLGPVQALRME